jgi:DNA invertase Pin-like site-specific DNA recombinase
MPIAPEHLHLAYSGPFDAILYGRASRDPKKRGRSVADQMNENRGLCRAHGWPIAAEFEDIDRSASRHAKRQRDKFEEMIATIESGHGRILVTWEASRFSRDLEVYVRLRTVCMKAGVLWCYNGVVYDLSKSSDRKATAQDAIQSEGEADAIRDRNLRTVRLNAQAGRPHGRLLYGYTRRYDPESGDLVEQIPHPEQAPIVAEIFSRIASGESVRSICASLPAKDPGRSWHRASLPKMLRNPAYIGRRIHQGEDIRDAMWPAIVDEETFRAVQRILATPGRAPVRRDSTVRHLFSGIAVCGECPDEPPLRVGKISGYDAYRCSTRGDTMVKVEFFHAYVEEAVVSWFESNASAEAFRNRNDDARAAEVRLRHERLTGQLREARELASQFRNDGSPKLSVLSLAAMEESLTPLIKAAEDEMKALLDDSSMPPELDRLLNNPDADAEWNALLLPMQRSVLRKVVTIRLFKARAPGVKAIEDGRVTLSFVGEPGFKTGDARVPERLSPARGMPLG